MNGNLFQIFYYNDDINKIKLIIIAPKSESYENDILKCNYI